VPAELDFAMKIVNMSNPTGQAPIMHSDYHRDSTLGQRQMERWLNFANSGLVTDPSSFFYIPTVSSGQAPPPTTTHPPTPPPKNERCAHTRSSVPSQTFVVGYDFATGCDDNFTDGGRSECEVGTGQGNCTPTWGRLSQRGLRTGRPSLTTRTHPTRQLQMGRRFRIPRRA